MGSAGDIVEISSDEDDFPMARKLPVDVDWIAKVFSDDDDETNGDDFIDLVVTGELGAPPVIAKKRGESDDGGAGEDGDDLVVMGELSAPAVLPQMKVKSDGVSVGEDDDDCVVLDSDPDSVTTVAEEKGSAGDCSSDELQIVAEKGPVACRDFPHSRHLCSNLPFGTTSHVKYCSMCHCFVCDAPAPCGYWGKGISTTDHCHATDKDSKWKILRQAFKSKSLPASHPVKHQNVVYPTTASPRQQDVHCQVSVPQSHPCPMSNIGRSSLTNQSSLRNVVSQDQQRHTSFRVSLNVERTVNAPRASPSTRSVRGTSNAHTVQINHSRARFKRVGGASPSLTIPNAHQFSSTAPISAPPLMQRALPHMSQAAQAAPVTNAFAGTVQNNVPQRSLSAPIACQVQQGQPAPSFQVASNGMLGIGPQLSRCTSLTTQRTQLLPEPVMDVCTKSWSDIVASLASDLGVSVSDDSDHTISTAQSQQPVMTFSQPLYCNANQGVALHSKSAAATANLMTSDLHDWPSQTTGGNVQANSTTQTSQIFHPPNCQSNLIPNGNPPNCQSNLIPNGAYLGSSVSSPADGLLMEAAHQRDSSGFDSTGVLFDFELEDWG